MSNDHRSIAIPRALPPAARAERRRNEWRVVRLLLPYLWEYRVRVIFALVFLITAKLSNVAVPLVLKDVVDSLDAKTAVLVMPLALLAAYGLLRFATTFFAELRDIVFVKVTQRAIRRVALAWNERISHRNAYLVAAVAAIPLWISSLGLLVASTAVNVALDVGALILSCGLVFQGVRSFCRIGDETIEQAIAITRLAFGGGLFAWGFLMLLIIV